VARRTLCPSGALGADVWSTWFFVTAVCVAVWLILAGAMVVAGLMYGSAAAVAWMMRMRDRR
jgi:hypothetical protein